MCGFAGFLEFGLGAQEMQQRLTQMADTMTHRGPDDAGYWFDPESGIGLAHRRLAILDLSPAGHQPMHSACGRLVLAFNGEIYNHLELREQLVRGMQAPGWLGHSDTETLLAAFAAWGVERTLASVVGMFAFALWDRQERMLTLARDRLGEKPLYYGWQKGTLLFGSELKALRANRAFLGGIDRDALTLLMRHSYIPAPFSIYQGIAKLPPGTFWQTNYPLVGRAQEGKLVTYWSAREVAEAGQTRPFRGDDNEAREALATLLNQSINGQMLADVPLGGFLSGGVDSSTVVALMQSRSKQPVKTFTIGFHEADYNEAEHALAVARHLGTEHTELYVRADEAQAVIPLLPKLYDEPFADSSQIPTYLVSRLAQHHVTVSLSGDGGDELFCGYNRYFLAQRIWRRLGLLPQPVRAALAGVLTSLPPVAWNAVFRRLHRWLPQRLHHANAGDKLHKLADILAVKSAEEIYWSLVSHWKSPQELVIGATEPATVLTESTQWAKLPDLAHRMMYLDTVTYLPDDILTKVDRAAMGVSLETRVPLLDHRVVEFAWTLPLSMKVRDKQSKWLLRQVLYQHVPKSLIERPKMGFGVPIDGWLRGPLKGWADDMLSPARLATEGYLNSSLIQEKWQEHQNGRRNWSYYLWDVLMFQAWYAQVH